MPNGEKERYTQTVQDKPAENGIKLNNIISFLILGVMAWVGYNIEEMKKNLAETVTSTAVNSAEIKHLQQGFLELKRKHTSK